MSPRGIAIPDVRRRLFDATERILDRHGPAGLTSRAITAEAGTATGLLFRHFDDLDDFLAAFVLDRMEQVHRATKGLTTRAGSGTVAENLADAALAIAPTASFLVDMVHTRPSVAKRLMAARHEHVGAIDEIERSFAAYLDEERRLARVAPGTDTGALALAITASIHQLSLRHKPGDAALTARIRHVVEALAKEIAVEEEGNVP